MCHFRSGYTTSGGEARDTAGGATYSNNWYITEINKTNYGTSAGHKVCFSASSVLHVYSKGDARSVLFYRKGKNSIEVPYGSELTVSFHFASIFFLSC